MQNCHDNANLTGECKSKRKNANIKKCAPLNTFSVFNTQSNQIKSNQKVLFKVGTFYNNQHKLSRAFQTDMHNKLHKLNTAQ
jgi:hypothetical protein